MPNSVMAKDAGLADYVIECSEAELQALRAVAREADGRKGETKLAREVLGVGSK